MQLPRLQNHCGKLPTKYDQNGFSKVFFLATLHEFRNYRDSRDVYASGHRVRTHKFWTGVTILFDKGCAPKRRRPSPKKPLCEDVLPGSKEDIDYPQSSKRKERPYTGTGKPNSISSDDWRAMSLTARRIYVSTERELEVEKSRSKPGDDHPGAPATSNKSLLIEFACEADSTLSATMFEFGGDAIRVHKDSFDILKGKDVRRLIEIVRKNPKCDLWSSIPCGPWSTWQYVNLSQYGPEFAAELNDARRQSQIMFAAFIRVSREVRKGGGRIAYEWPRHCLGWSQPFMKKFLDDPEILTVNIDGCDFGMKDKNGTPIRKQWRIATNSPDARIEGSLTPLTALYPKQMCQTIIKSWYKGRGLRDLRFLSRSPSPTTALHGKETPMHSTSILFGKGSLSRIAGLLKALVWIFNRPMIT